MTGPVGSAASPGPSPTASASCSTRSSKFHGFLWASGGCFSDFLIHNIDECCWMKDAWPVKAKGSGGRALSRRLHRPELRHLLGRVHLRRRHQAVPRRPEHRPAAHQEFASYAHGTKGSAVISTSVAHARPAAASTRARTSRTKDDLVWAFPQPEPNPYQVEWDDLIDAIRKDKPYNEVKRGAEASLVTSMGRMAAHTGQVITFDDMLNCKHEFAPNVDKLTLDGPAPAAGRQGRQVPGAATGHGDEAGI